MQQTVSLKGIMKGDHQVVLFILVFLAGSIFGGLLEDRWTATYIKDFLPSLATLIAAFIGAWLAFQLQNRKETEKIQRENLASGNRAIFLLARFANELELIRRQVIEPVRNRPDRPLAMSPTLLLDYKELRFDVDSVAFLLETEFPNLLGELVLEESRFHSAIEALNHRSRLHLSEIQPALEKTGIKQGSSYTVEQIKSALGERLFFTVRQATDQAVEAVDGTVVSCEEVANKMAAALKALFPEAKVIRYEIQKAQLNPPADGVPPTRVGGGSGTSINRMQG